jgi:hypothetical protein
VTAVSSRDVERLLAEIERYLVAVDAFRSEGCQITWIPTPSPIPKRRNPR